LSAANTFSESIDATNLTSLREAYSNAYLAYQAVAVHNYFRTISLNLVDTSNLYPIEVDQLESFIEDESYSFESSTQIRATGYPALDYLLYGPDDVVAFFNEDSKRVNYLIELITFLHTKSDDLVEEWDDDLRDAFISSSGTSSGSAISTQLNNSLVYYEEHIRENKVGLPIGQAGPLDPSFDADGTKIEAYYQSLFDGNDSFSLSLVKAAVEELEDLYLGSQSNGTNDQGYDDLLITTGQDGIDTNDDIKTQFQNIYTEIDNRTAIIGNPDLYDEVQEIITLFKADLFSLLNIVDADMANDGD